MIELPLVLMGGVLGSAHCLGMCGPLALAVGVGQLSLGANLRRQLSFSVGRICTYALLGSMAGYSGAWLSRSPGLMVHGQAALSLFAGLCLVLLGLKTAGVFPRLRWPGHVGGSCSAGWIRAFLTRPGLGSAALAGVFTGLLPCGLVYAFLAMAAATSHMGWGALTMIAFGVGTVPLMVLTGCGGSLLGFASRQRVFQVAAWCVVVTGMISMVRAAGLLELTGAPSSTPSAACPFCP
jgi:sulfite exporter TauE/SafE